MTKHHPTHLATKTTIETRRTPILIIDGITYGGTEYTVEVFKRDYHGFIICVATDIDGDETITIEGVDGDFESDESAADHIDNVLNCGDDDYYNSRADMEAEWRAY